MGRVETQKMKLFLVDNVGLTLSLSPIIFEYLYKKIAFVFNLFLLNAFVFNPMLSYVLGYILHPTPNFELRREELSCYIIYFITNLFRGVSTFKSMKYKTPNLLAKYHMVVLNLSDQVAEGWLMKIVKDVRIWFDFGLGLCGLSRWVLGHVW